MSISIIKSLDRTLRRWAASLVYELRRTRRVIVDPETRPRGVPPIFVLGVHRSGTTLLRLILDSHSRIACPPESFFLVPLAGVLQDAKAMEGLEAMGFSREHVLGRLRQCASYFFEMYAASRAKPRWADKTPSYVGLADLIETLFGPDCRYVVIYRHGLDTACSIAGMTIREVAPHLEACGGDRLAAAARYWAEGCGRLLDFQARHASRCFELRYERLTQDPEPHLRRMFEFLGEPWEPQVLRFHEKPHDHWVGLQDAKAAESKGFEPRTGVWRQQPAEVVERMRAQAGPMLRRLGYE
jgi:hypothetical protein